MTSLESSKKMKHTLSDLKTLGHQLLSSRTHINNLPLLLSHVNPTNPTHYVFESLLSLQSFFLSILPDLPSSTVGRSKSKDDSEFIYRAWLHSKFHDFINSLIDVYVSPHSEDTFKEVVLDTIMEFVKLGNAGRFNSAIYHRLLSSIVSSTSKVGFLLDLLASKYFKYIDVRYFTCKSLGKIARTLKEKHFSDNGVASADGAYETLPSSSVEHAIRNLHNTISRVPPLEGMDSISDFEVWSSSGFFSRGSGQKQPSGDLELDDNQLKTEKQISNVLSSANIVKNMKLEFTRAWISYLRIPLPLDVYKEVLVSLHQAVIPHLSKPIMLCDFLTKSYDIGGVVSVMALSSLYVLMTQYGLEYPNFYEKLYALLVPSIFMAKHRAKFFQLLDSCLKSPLLPAYLAASFAKRLSRLLLSVSPSGALVITALIHNLLRRHPSINCMVHWEDDDEEGTHDHGTDEVLDANFDSSKTGAMPSQKAGIDYYDNEETNPKKSSAISSSLWEIDTIRHHYCPPVSRFVLSLENDLTIRAKTSEISVEDFSSGSYATIFGEEMRRRVKQVPSAFYKAIPPLLFKDTDLAGWSFILEDYQETIHGNRENDTRDLSEHNHTSTKRQRKEGP